MNVNPFAELLEAMTDEVFKDLFVFLPSTVAIRIAPRPATSIASSTTTITTTSRPRRRRSELVDAKVAAGAL